MNGDEIKPKNEDVFFQILHDIKSPALAIKFALENVKRTPLEDDIYDINAKILNLIEDFLTLYSFENAQTAICLNLLDLNTLIEDELSLFKYISDKKNIFINFIKSNRECVVSSKKHIISRIISNLIMNAIKYAKPNSVILLKLYENKQNVLISIVNDFQKFAQPDSKFGSNGLGLIICKRLSSLIKAQISHKQVENKMIFEIILPKG